MNKIITLSSLITVSVLLTGCVAPKKYTWHKAGVSDDEMFSYYKDCEYNVGMNHLTPEKEQSLMRACMQKAGFRWVVK